MKKLLSLTLILALGLASQALAGNVVVTNPATQPVPVTSVAKVGTTPLATTTAYSVHLTTNATTTVIGSTAYVYTVTVAVSGAGSAWLITIRSKEGTPKILYQATAAVGTSTPISAEVPIGLTSGIDIVTSGTTPGTADIWITYSQ
jgi:flagellar capping protein FliD